MWRKTIIGLVTFKIMCSVVNASNTGNKDIKSLPYCGNKNGSGYCFIGFYNFSSIKAVFLVGQCL